MPRLDPQHQRQFAVAAVTRLRDAGFVAYWAGGCVRDQLLGRTPKDYDVATDATPEQIRELFGRRRTLAIGAAFGVISVLGRRSAGQIEVTTFRRDAAYSDGRHPDAVTFTSPQEDATRRDFTINGLFFDPLSEQVIDYVGGQADLAAGVIRAIGRPQERFAEDKLRMLRAVRFAATFGFRIEPQTAQAIQAMAHEIVVVSPERIAMEMRRMLVCAGRATGIRLLRELGLANAVLPELCAHETRLGAVLSLLEALLEPGFSLALAALLTGLECPPTDVEALAQRWRLSNAEREQAAWLVAHATALDEAPERPWSQVQSILAHPIATELVALCAARLRVAERDVAVIDWCRAMLARPAAELDPLPLATGDDLLRHGLPAGPQYRRILQQIRAAQLDGLIHTLQEALELADRLRGRGD